MGAGVKFKQNLKFNRKMTGYGASRVVLSDARTSSVVFNWSVINLCTSVGDFTSCQSLFHVARRTHALPLGCTSTESFLSKPLSSFFLWNSFICANSFSPTTIFYLRRLRRLSPKTVMPVKIDSTYRNFFAWLLSSLSGTGYLGEGVPHSDKVLPSFALYFKLLEVWFFLNEVSERELSLNPSFLSSGWSSGFLPFLNFSLKTTFGLFGVFTTFYPFFLVSRIFVRSDYSLFRIFSASKLLEFRVNYVDHLPYESRSEFSFRSTPALVARLRGYSLCQSMALKTFTFQMEGGVDELSLGDRKNSRIPYHFYFNEFDFLRASTFITNFKDRDDRLFQNEILRLFFSWFLLDVHAFVLDRWKQSVSFHLSSPRAVVSQVVFFAKVLSEDLVKRWILTLIGDVSLNNAFRRFCNIWSITDTSRNYTYNNLMRPAGLMFLLGQLLVSRLWLYVEWSYFAGYFFGNWGFYLFSIKNVALRSLFWTKEKNWLIFSRIFVELYAFNNFFIRTGFYFFILVFKEFSRKLNLNRLKLLIGIFSICVFISIMFYNVGSFCLVVLGVLLLWVFCRYSNWSTGLPAGVELPSVSSFFGQAAPHLVFFRHSCVLFNKLFFKVCCSYYFLYSLAAVFFRHVNVSSTEGSRIFLLSTWYLKKNSSHCGVFSSFGDCFVNPQYLGLISAMIAYNSFYSTSTWGFWNMFNLSRTAVGGYGWWNSGLVNCISHYTSSYYLNRLSTFSYDSAHLISAKVPLQLVYGALNFRVLQLYVWLNAFGMSSIFYQLLAWSLLYRDNSLLCSLNGNLLTAFVHSGELVTRELGLKSLKASIFTYKQPCTNRATRVYLYIFSTICALFRFFWDIAHINFFFLVKLFWFVIVVILMLFTLQFLLYFFFYFSFWVVFLVLYLLLKCFTEFFIFCFADSDSR